MEFAILGPLEVRRDECVVALGGEKPRTLLAVLLLHANEPVSAERLALVLWGQDAPSGAVRTVQVYVSRLRRALGDRDLLATTPAGYRLLVGPRELDAARFGELSRRGADALVAGDYDRAAATLREALDLWRGSPLAELALDVSLQQEVRQLEEQRLVALESRIEAELRLGRHAELIGELRALVAAHPLEERLHALLMEALYGAGRQADALDAYRRARETLVERVGIEPSPALRRLHAAILSQDPALEPPERPIGWTGVQALPQLPDRTVGRDLDIRQGVAMLARPDVRLLTLTGAGGVGKTRLALELAHRLEHEFAEGACFVDLSGLSNAADVPAAIGHAAGVAPQEGESVAVALTRQLAAQQRLLVLDNFEQVLAAGTDLAELLGACRQLKVIATSREPLGLRVEQRFAVSPLETADAAELLIERASRYDAPVSATRDRAAVAAICARLDGLPLALELAAARLAILSPAELAERLSEAHAAVGAGPRDAPARQRTLAATLDWSHDLLAPAERAAFAAFSTFVGGATVEAAEAVTASSLDMLAGLADKSLLSRRGERLVMLEVIRQYAGARLARTGTADSASERHARYYLRLADAAAPHLFRAGRSQWLARLEPESANIRAAVAWALAARQGPLALRLATALVEFWDVNNATEDGVRWLDDALASAEIAASDRAGALLARAELRDWGLGSTTGAAAAQADATEALATYRSLGDRLGAARALSALAALAGHCGAMRRARELATDALALARAAGDELEIARAHARRACTAATIAEARPELDLAMTTFRALGSDRYLSVTLSTVGFLAISAGDYDEATRLLTDALPAAEQVGVPRRIAIVHGSLGLAALLSGRHDDARAAFRAQLTICANAMLESVANEGLAGMAALAAIRRDTPLAARLLGAAERFGFRATGAEARVYRRVLRRYLEPAHAASPPDAWARNKAAGKQMDLRAAIAHGLDAQP
jgi:predicted ATPase/DNA-binding SARP family transcriptional activator